MMTDNGGNMKAAVIAVNWGDYFSFLLDNPKGVFKALAKLVLASNEYILVSFPKRFFASKAS